MRGRGEESEREASVHEQNRAFDANLLPGRPRRPSTYQYAQNDVALIDPHLHVSVPTPRIPRPPPPSPHIPRARRVGHAPPLDGPARGFDAGRASVSAALAARGRRVEPPAGSSQSRSRATAGRCRERPRSRLRVLSRGPLPAAPDAVRRVRRNPDRRLPRRAERRGAHHEACLRCDLCHASTSSFVSVKARPELLCCPSCHDATFAETCAGCRGVLRGGQATLRAFDRPWHAGCFACDLCRAPHPPGASFIPRGEPPGSVCARCHLEHVAPKCARCGDGVADVHHVALGRTYHRGCFRCVRCDADVASSYVAHEGEPWCGRCHVDAHAPRCGCGCGRGVEGEIVRALGRKFLAACFRCADCRRPFPGGSFVDASRSSSSSAAASPRAGGDLRPTFDRTGTDSGAERRNVLRDVVCASCYATNRAERCAACATPLVDCRFARTKEWGEAMCTACETRPGSVCDDCGRCVKMGSADGAHHHRSAASPSARKTRGRRAARRRSGGEAVIGQCDACEKRAVTTDEDAAKLFRRVVAAMADLGAGGVAAIEIVAGARKCASPSGSGSSPFGGSPDGRSSRGSKTTPADESARDRRPPGPAPRTIRVSLVDADAWRGRRRRRTEGRTRRARGA